MAVAIARAAETHIPEISQLWLEFMRFHADIDPIFTPREGVVPGFEQEQVRRLMQSEDGLVLVALDDDQVVGFAFAEIRGPSKVYMLDRYGALDTMAVTAKYRRRGVGERMLDEILKWCRSKGVVRIELEALANNQLGLSFWAKHGFKIWRHRLYLDAK